MAQILLIFALVSVGGIAGGGGLWYFQHETIEACNAHWKREIQDANTREVQTKEDRDTRVLHAQSFALTWLAEAEQRVDAEAGNLELARSTAPLPYECGVCRVPSARVWGLSGNTVRGWSNHLEQATVPPEHRPEVAPATGEYRLQGGEEKRVRDRRTDRDPGVREKAKKGRGSEADRPADNRR